VTLNTKISGYIADLQPGLIAGQTQHLDAELARVMSMLGQVNSVLLASSMMTSMAPVNAQPAATSAASGARARVVEMTAAGGPGAVARRRLSSSQQPNGVPATPVPQIGAPKEAKGGAAGVGGSAGTTAAAGKRPTSGRPAPVTVTVAADGAKAAGSPPSPVSEGSASGSDADQEGDEASGTPADTGVGKATPTPTPTPSPSPSSSADLESGGMPTGLSSPGFGSPTPSGSPPLGGPAAAPQPPARASDMVVVGAALEIAAYQFIFGAFAGAIALCVSTSPQHRAWIMVLTPLLPLILTFGASTVLWWRIRVMLALKGLKPADVGLATLSWCDRLREWWSVYTLYATPCVAGLLAAALYDYAGDGEGTSTRIAYQRYLVGVVGGMVWFAISVLVKGR
jgi:hypothetical protein